MNTLHESQNVIKIVSMNISSIYRLFESDFLAMCKFYSKKPSLKTFVHFWRFYPEFKCVINYRLSKSCWGGYPYRLLTRKVPYKHNCYLTVKNGGLGKGFMFVHGFSTIVIR